LALGLGRRNIGRQPTPSWTLSPTPIRLECRVTLPRWPGETPRLATWCDRRWLTTSSSEEPSYGTQRNRCGTGIRLPSTPPVFRADETAHRDRRAHADGRRAGARS
jgi:hypothetical protein